VVVLILGILGSVAVPKFINTTQVASKNAFVTQLISYADAFDIYKAENGAYPSDSAAGTLPSGMEKYLNPAEFALETPLGGKWDFGLSGNIVIGVVYENGKGFPGVAVMLELDTLLDDGNLATGSLVLVNSTHKFLYWGFGNK
jgi:type II secretory pathway pseudopilin PulG